MTGFLEESYIYATISCQGSYLWNLCKWYKFDFIAFQHLGMLLEFPAKYDRKSEQFDKQSSFMRADKWRRNGRQEQNETIKEITGLCWLLSGWYAGKKRNTFGQLLYLYATDFVICHKFKNLPLKLAAPPRNVKLWWQSKQIVHFNVQFWFGFVTCNSSKCVTDQIASWWPHQ